MRRGPFLLALALAAGGWAGQGCDRKPAVQPSGGGARDAATAGPAEPNGSRSGLDAGLPVGFIDPIQAKDQIRDPLRYASKIDEMARQVDPNDAPLYAKKMVEHMRQIAILMNDNLADCDRVVVVLREYIDKHRAELKVLNEEGNRIDAGLSPEDRAKLQAQTLLLMSPFAESLARAQGRFVVDCGTQAHDVAELMKAVVGD